MPKEKLDLIVEGGKATTTPQLAQKLGPLRINISEVIKKINEKTESFFGVKVPIKVIIDTDTKEVDISVGTPPVSELIINDLKSAVKNVIGSCNSLGVYVENEPAKFFIKKIDQGNFDNDIKQVKKEPSQEKLAELKNKLKEVQLVYMKEQEKIKAEEEKAKEAATAAATGVGEDEKKEETKPAEPKKEEKKKEEKKK